MYVQQKKAEEAIESFGKSEFKTILFLRECLPSLFNKQKAMQERTLGFFQEVKYAKGQVILSQGQAGRTPVFLIA